MLSKINLHVLLHPKRGEQHLVCCLAPNVLCVSCIPPHKLPLNADRTGGDEGKFGVVPRAVLAVSYESCRLTGGGVGEQGVWAAAGGSARYIFAVAGLAPQGGSSARPAFISLAVCRLLF